MVSKSVFLTTLEVYKDKLGEYPPTMEMQGYTDEELIYEMEKAIETSAIIEFNHSDDILY